MPNLPTTRSSLGLRIVRGIQRRSLLVLLPALLATAALHAAAIFPIATNPLPEVSLSAAFDGTNYLVAIQGGPLDHDEVTYQLLSNTGTLVGSKTSTGHFGSIPHVAFDGNRYLVIWQDVTNSSRNIWGQFVSRLGAISGGAFRITGFGTVAEQDLDFMRPIASGGTNYLVVYR